METSLCQMDVEGAELDGLSEWMLTGALDYVDQLGIELHTAHNFNGYEVPIERFKILLETSRELYENGFRIVSYEINYTAGKAGSNFYPFFEVVFVKDILWNHIQD